jgi:hypothetical protein
VTSKSCSTWAGIVWRQRGQEIWVWGMGFRFPISGFGFSIITTCFHDYMF